MTDVPGLADVSDELYACDPADFVARREVLAREARDRKDRALAQAIKKLRRPTVGAWYVNLAVRAGFASLRELLRLGHEMRDAQANLRPEVVADVHLSRVEFRVAARKGRLKAMPAPDRQIESRKASVRAKVEHPFLILRRDFGFTKARYRGLAKNLNQLHIAFASANLLMRARAVALQAG